MGDFTQQDLNTYKSVLFDEDEQNKLLELDLISKFDNADKSGFNFLLPYVGKNYKKQRILIVAESKYIETTDDDVPAKTFYKWIINRVLNQNDDSEVADFIDTRRRGEGDDGRQAPCRHEALHVPRVRL